MGVAQRIEQYTTNVKVEGSSPSIHTSVLYTRRKELEMFVSITSSRAVGNEYSNLTFGTTTKAVPIRSGSSHQRESLHLLHQCKTVGTILRGGGL